MLSTAEVTGATVNVLTYVTGLRADQQLDALTVVSSGNVIGRYYPQASNDFAYPVSSPLGQLPRGEWFELELHLDLAAAPASTAGSIVVAGRSTDVKFDQPFVVGTYGLHIGPHDLKMGTNAAGRSGWTSWSFAPSRDTRDDGRHACRSRHSTCLVLENSAAMALG